MSETKEIVNGATTETAYATSEADKYDKKHAAVIRTLLSIINLAGYRLLNRIELKCNESGRIYR